MKCEQQLLQFRALHVLFSPPVSLDNSGLQHVRASLGGRAIDCSVASRSVDVPATFGVHRSLPGKYLKGNVPPPLRITSVRRHTRRGV